MLTILAKYHLIHWWCKVGGGFPKRTRQDFGLGVISYNLLANMLRLTGLLLRYWEAPLSTIPLNTQFAQFIMRPLPNRNSPIIDGLWIEESSPRVMSSWKKAGAVSRTAPFNKFKKICHSLHFLTHCQLARTSQMFILPSPKTYTVWCFGRSDFVTKHGS